MRRAWGRRGFTPAVRFLQAHRPGVHIAWAVGTPTVSLYGPNPSARNGPRGEAHRRLQAEVDCSPCWGKQCPTGHFICMESIGVEQVVAAAAPLLPSDR